MLRRLALPVLVVINEVGDLRSRIEEESLKRDLTCDQNEQEDETGSLDRIILLSLFPSQSSFLRYDIASNRIKIVSR